MIPVLLDVLTIIFIVGSLALLWVNLRVWRTRSFAPAPPVHGVAHPHINNKDQSAGTTEVDMAASRAAAIQCLDEADRSTSETDRQAWLGMAAGWIKLAEDAERRGTEHS
jgi:hypothetical protein